MRRDSLYLSAVRPAAGVPHYCIENIIMENEFELEEHLAVIEEAWMEDEEERREAVLDALRQIHLEAMRDAGKLAEFNRRAPDLCGGLFIPYLFWTELVRFLDGAGDRQALYDLIAAFARSNFDEEDQMKIKPLLAVYFQKERDFEVNRVKNDVISKAHPEVRRFLNGLTTFHEQNASTARAYYEKLLLLKGYYPDFEQFNKPTQQLKAELAAEEE